ncbi:MAG: sporulation protein YqfD [Clostridia bacterium]|nr:sporulation protein YqfD [Clostridia bacterium]
MSARSWKNTVTIRITEKNFEKFLNECRCENILITDISKDSCGYLCSMSFKSFKRIRKAARMSGVRISIVHKQGAGYFVRMHKKRYGFYAGALISVLLLVYLTSCIWVVEVVGNEATPTQEILSVLNDNGIGIGKLRYGKDISYIKNKSLIELDSLSWLWVTVEGTRAVVEVRESTPGLEILNTDIPHNLVASHSGLITDMQVKYGQKVVARDSVVSEGDLLVTGVCTTKTRGNRYVNAYGTVTARTWRTKSGEYHHTARHEIKTGSRQIKRSIQVFGKKIKLYTDSKPDFKHYTKQTKIKQIKLFKNIYLPLSFTTDEFCEIIIENEILSDDVVASQAADFLTDEIKKERSDDAVTINRTYSYEELRNGNLYVTVTLESEENIARPVKIEVDTTEEDASGESN